MPDNKIKIDSATLENWNYYLKLHGTDDYRMLKMREFEQELQKCMEEYEKRMQPVYEVYAIISPHYIATEGPTTKRIIELPKYRAIAYDEILKCIEYQDEKEIIWRDPLDDLKHGKVGRNEEKFMEISQFVYENFLEETFYQYAVTKAIASGQSLKEKEALLKRQVSHNTRLGKKAPLKKYNIVRQARGIVDKASRYTTKFLDFYNNPYFALPLASWTNIFSANGVYYPEETDFRDSIKELISKYLKKTLSEKSRFPLLDKKIKEQDNFEKDD